MGTGLQVYITPPFLCSAAGFQEPSYLYNYRYFPLITIFRVTIFRRKQVISICKQGIFNPQAMTCLQLCQLSRTRKQILDSLTPNWEKTQEHPALCSPRRSHEEPGPCSPAAAEARRCDILVQARSGIASKTSNWADFLKGVSERTLEPITLLICYQR